MKKPVLSKMKKCEIEAVKANVNLLLVNLDRLDHCTRDIVLESYDDTCVFPLFQPKRSKKKSK